MTQESERERHLRELTQHTIIDRENDHIVGDVGLHPKPIEYRDESGELIASTERRRDDRHPMEQISDAANDAVRSGKLVEGDERPSRPLPRTKRGEGVPGETWEETQARKLNTEREKIKSELLIWARQEVARHITITSDSQAVEQGRADHWLLPQLCRLEIPVQPE